MYKHTPFLAALLLSVCMGTAGAAATFTYTPSHNKGGDMQPPERVTVDEGQSLLYSIDARPGFYIADIKLDGKSIAFEKGPSYSDTLANITSNHRVAARFAANPVITVRGNTGGTITPSGGVKVAYGANQSFALQANEGYHVGSVKVDGKLQPNGVLPPFTQVVGKHTVVVNFAVNTYDIATDPGPHGRISPKEATVKHGTSRVFTIVPEADYKITSITVGGNPVSANLPAVGSYQLRLGPITENLTIQASFEKIVITGMQIGNQVSVVDAHGNTQHALPLAVEPRLAMQALANPVDGLPLDSAYFTDPTRVYVHEKAGDAFKTVNQILCMIDQTQYADSGLLNADWYKAMVNKAVCEGQDSTDNASTSQQGGTSATNAPRYDTWTVKSARTSETGEQTFSAFVHTTGGDGDVPMTIKAKMVITEGATDTNPLGLFTMTFAGSPDGAPASAPPMLRGVLKTEIVDGKVVIKFTEQEGPDNQPFHLAKAAFVKDDVLHTGQGSAMQIDTNGGRAFQDRVNFAYDADYFLRASGGGEPVGQCLDRGSFETSAWRYGLYDATLGSRINLEAGFPINTRSDGKGAYGFLGYHGLNLPPSAQPLQDGATVYRMTWDGHGQNTTPYDLILKGGKLKKHVRSSITLADIKNIPLEGGIPVPGNMQQNQPMYRVTWDGQQLAVIAQAQPSTNGPMAWTDLETPLVIDQTRTLFNSIIGLYSQSLGGQVNIQLSNCKPVQQNNPGMGVTCDTPTEATPVIFYKESVVTLAGPFPANLSCYDNCPKAGGSGMDGSSPQAMVYPRDFNAGSNTRHDYSFHDMLLFDGNNAALLKGPSMQPWGFNSGPLFEANNTNLAALACDWDATQTCGWKAWNALTEFYTWETGPNNWNWYTSAENSSTHQVVQFEEPWQVAYTYSLEGTGGVNPTAIDSQYGGAKFFLQYSGFGDLNGIPGKCIDPATNQPVTDCSQGGLRWVPEFTIPAGSLVTHDNIDYLVKPLEMEQRMAITEPVNCANLTVVDMSNQWPDLKTDWVSPGLGAEPVITESPRVIGGVVQDTQP